MINYNIVEDNMNNWKDNPNVNFIHFHTGERFMPHFTLISVSSSEILSLLTLIIEVGSLEIHHSPKHKTFFIILTDEHMICEDENHIITIDYNSPETSINGTTKTRSGNVIVLDQPSVPFTCDIKIKNKYTKLKTQIADIEKSTSMYTGKNTYASQKAYHTIDRNIILTYFEYILKQYNLKFKNGKILKY